MKIKVYTYILISALTAIKLSASATTLALTGKVTDAANGEALVGAIISIPELQQSTVTNKEGEYTFARLPLKGRFMIEVRYIGYKTATKNVDFSTLEAVNFALQPSVIEVHEIVITGTASGTDNRTNSTSVTTIGKAELTGHASNNLIDALSRLPGVSQVTTGAAVSKPVIRGLGSNRIITLSDGVKQEGQQWGDEHGIEVDQYSAERVEVLRGAASLLYGSDALGGVINIIDPLPPSAGHIKGEVLSNFATNNGLTGNSAMLEGNSNGFVWQGRGTYKNAFSFNTPQGRIPNTGFKETNFGGLLGLNRSWGFSHLNISSFNQKLGLPDFEKNTQGKYEDSEGNIFTSEQLKNRELLLPLQDVLHYKIALNSTILGNRGRLKSILAFQDNQRKEFEESAGVPSLSFDLKTYSFDFKYYFNERNGWEPVMGASGALQNSKNKASEFLIPDYDSKDFGAFAYTKKTWSRTTFNTGLRVDYRDIRGIEMIEEGNSKFNNFSNKFYNLSGAIGLTHELNDKWNIKSNLGSAFRAPNIAELSSEGVHEGTFRYEVGENSLKPERSIYADIALEFHNQKVDFHLDLYNNYIGNYIYSRQLSNESITVGGNDLAVYRYVQGNANLYGLEAGLTLHPTSFIHVENSFSITRGNNVETSDPLPFMPAPNLRNEVKFEPGFKSPRITSTYISIGLNNVFRQNRIDNEFETITRAYALVDASAGTTLKLSNQSLRIYVSGNNLFDKAYVDHLNRLKYVGMLNQGRNISIGIQVPFAFGN